jgi:plastocyanin
MRLRHARPLMVALLTAVVLAACNGEDVEELDAEFEELDDDANDSEPLDPEADPDEQVAEEAGVAEGRTEVVIDDNSFNPPSLEVEVGDTVTWTHEGANSHNVTAREFESGGLSGGDVFEFTFEESGTFPYECTIHQGMSGEIVVG